MSDIEFEADFDNNPHRRAQAAYTSMGGGASQMGQVQGGSHIGMVNWLIRHGIITGESSAKAFLIGLISINFIATGLILYFFVLR
ncbi:MAG TPA: hypothetical protein VL335_03005 [Candidatus Paceibacterota bacterium]|jgi:hypothetical protein|nr:hypothetical protein [Candidatus Paceibacterota bacterium]